MVWFWLDPFKDIRLFSNMTQQKGLIDVHTHLDKLDLASESALAEAEKLGVTELITIGTEPSDHSVVLDLAQKYYPRVFCSLGVHPHAAVEWRREVGERIREWAKNPWVVAIGETGLDYFYQNSAPDQQRRAFEEQLELARSLGLPVQVHMRDAEADTLAILKNFGSQVTGIIHCFSGSDVFADAVLELGWYLSISGIVTFKNAQKLREQVARFPIDRLTVETDAPYLTPVPYRGKKNMPAYTHFVAAEIARVKNVSLEEVVGVTRSNTLKMFFRLLPALEN
ncbi:MAG: TatD family hydrolase [Bdellovibrionaceae bacterium]|nr:TatD family hydrolase [Pseudobdellovibrionaceae bacterium]MDW8190567.1 TatD family hydrolase [Pseudobdellovibrionaceae bacterium]